MKAYLITLASLLILIAAVPCAASEENPEETSFGSMLQTDQALYLDKLSDISTGDPVILAKSGEFNDFPSFGGDLYSSEHKSIGRAFLYSALVPGLGEYYSGSRVKAALFFAFDIFAWSQYLGNHGKGRDREDEFELFANSHWSPTQYTVWLIEEWGITDDEDTTNQETTFTHNLPDEKTQQYYEMIGKYEQFLAGWDDYDADAESSAKRQAYLEMRDDANNKLNTARTWVMISLANHFLSAFDAALSAKSFNKRKDVFSNVNVKARLAKYDGERIPQITLTYKFY